MKHNLSSTLRKISYSFCNHQATLKVQEGRLLKEIDVVKGRKTYKSHHEICMQQEKNCRFFFLTQFSNNRYVEHFSLNFYQTQMQCKISTHLIKAS